MNTHASHNKHPAVMFEIMADQPSTLVAFYHAVFGWHVEAQGGFNYIKFPSAPRALLGGIGQAQKDVVGWKKGLTFYLEVPHIDQALVERIQAHGGKVLVQRTPVDGYVFAMFEDPEQNLLGLIEPF
jgi:predicted enzyme related to lactoylglutathione lyase